MTASLVICHKIINIHHTMATSKEERFLKSASIRKYFGSSLQPSLSCPSSTMSNKNTYLKRSTPEDNAQCQVEPSFFYIFCSVVQLLIILIAYQQGLFLAVWQVFMNPKLGKASKSKI